MTSLYVLPGLFALFVWWFSTGAIMFLDGLPRRTFKYSLAGATVLFAASLWGIWAGSADTSVRGAYIAFACGLTAWGWQEISFYMGFVTGPRSAPCPDGCSGWRHFGHAIQTSLWHELAIIAAALVVGTLTWHQPNKVGFWTFMVLWWMHQSAKLNVFLGVRNLNEEFLPEHLQFLRSFLTKKSMNLLFPVSITISTVILVLMIQVADAPGASAFTRASGCFLSVLMGLAILEHWLLMLPLPAAALWGWSLKSRAAIKPFDVEVVSGFLGAGKTTFLRAMLTKAGPKTVVLVNDFAAMSVDGSLLAERGADVVELPNGCICCSLRQDLAEQLKTVVASFAPERVLIEPSGVADLASLLGVLERPELKPMLRSLAVTTVLDAGAFLADYARLSGHLEAQVRLASVLVVNKSDVVGDTERRLVETTLRGLNPTAQVVPSCYGVAMPELARAAPPRRQPVAAAVAPSHEHQHDAHDHAPGHDNGHDHGHDHGHDPGHDPGRAHDRGHDHGHAHEHSNDEGHAHQDGLGLGSWSATLGQSCDATRVEALLETVCGGAFGEVERLKGIARVGDGWIRFDLAGGRPSMAAFAPAASETPRVVAIGRDLDTHRLQQAFDACAYAMPNAA